MGRRYGARGARFRRIDGARIGAAGQMLTRSGAQNGDDVYVTGTIGDGFLDLERCGTAYADPQPPLAFGQALRGIAHAAIDVSDGLMADLDHICAASGGVMEMRRRWFRSQKPGRAW